MQNADLVNGAGEGAAAEQAGGLRALLDQLEQRLRDLAERFVCNVRARVAGEMAG